MDMLPTKVIFWGGRGQAIVNRPILEQRSGKLVAIFDDTPALSSPFPDVPIFEGKLGFETWIAQQPAHELGFVIAIGNPHGRVRLSLHEYLVGFGLSPVSLIHPSAIIAPDVKIGEGAQIMAGVVIQPRVVLGRQCILNTRSSVDHECVLEDGTEVGPGAILCGCIHVEAGAWVASGAVVLPRRRIGADAIVGAGAVVTKDVTAGSVVIGVPARPMQREKS